MAMGQGAFGLLHVDLGVSLLLIRTGEASSANVTAEGFLTGVRPYMRCQVVTSREGSMTDATLQWTLDFNVNRCQKTSLGHILCLRGQWAGCFSRSFIRAP